MNEQEKATRFSAQLDQLLHSPARQPADDQLITDDDQALMDLAQKMAVMDFSPQSQFRRQIQQPTKGVNKMLFARNGRHALAAVGVTLLLLVMAVTLIAPVRAFAQELLQGLFVRHESSTMAVEPYDPVTDPTPTPVPAQVDVPNLTIAEAEALASFAVKELTNLPDGFALSSVYYDEERDKVTFLYLDEGYKGIVLHQEPADIAEPWTIGADAVIEVVTVGDFPGEYVRGAWQWGEPATEGAVGSTEMVWKSDDPHQQLRWTQDGIVYTLSTTVGQDLGLTQADLIALAESVK
ncbi:MAG: hypothetical protein CL608_03075 [Anaerolineaceae bacterium]|nr:hypothetical protein [Anaerolineaceae bacterium]